MPEYLIRPARTSDVTSIRKLIDIYAPDRRLLSKATVALYESVPEFIVAQPLPPATSAKTDTSPGLGRAPENTDSPATSHRTSELEAQPSITPASYPSDSTAAVLACGALHVMWEDLAEVRTLAVAPEMVGRGAGKALLRALLDRARDIGVKRVFVLTFERGFFANAGFTEIEGTPVSPDVYEQLLRSYDEGVAEFLDLERVKPNTLGNTRMLLIL